MNVSGKDLSVIQAVAAEGDDQRDHEDKDPPLNTLDEVDDEWPPRDPLNDVDDVCPPPPNTREKEKFQTPGSAL
jgi:hypothetical protein